MDTVTFFLVLAGIAVLAWFLFGTQSGREVRVRLGLVDKKAARAMESVDAYTESARSKQEEKHQKSRRSLYEVSKEIAEAELVVARIRQEVQLDNAALAAAREAEDREAFEGLVVELNADQADLKQEEATLATLRAEAQGFEGIVDEIAARKREIESQGRVLRSQARVADVKTELNEAKAGLAGDNNAEAHMAKAQEIVDRKMATATAADRAADGLTANERAQRKAARFLEQAKRGTGVDADDLWNQMGSGETAETVEA